MKFLGKDISGPFTIPSGIITVTYDAILHMAKASDELGVITTKSIGPEPRSGNREPILAQNDSSTRNSFQNAVGLAGPGCATSAKELSCSEPLPPNKFLLVSIFGKNTHEFIAVAKTLEKYADGFELNFSCPHAEGHGSELCSTPGLATEIIRSLRDALPTKPVVPKLSPNLSNHALQELVRDFVHAGASAFSAINTVGPKKSDVLTKKMGGISGPIVFERAREVVRLIRTTLDAMGRAEIPILGMGGVATCEDVQAMRASGANVIGIGTSLLGLDTAQCVETLKWLNKNPSLEATAALKALQRTASNMVFRPYTVKQVHRNGNYNAIIDFRESIETRPGQFVMVWIPGHGEKPFAPAKRNPLTLVVRNVGALTSHLTSDLEEGSCVYIRGVYGTSFYVPQPRASPKRYIDMIGTHLEHPQTVDTFVLVGGSTGIAPLLLLAEDLSNVSGLSRDRILVFLGGRSARDIYFKSEFESIATVYIATGDGSEGSKGTVIDVMKSVLKQSVESNVPRTFYFYNCGPEMMMFHAYSAQKEFRHGTLECSIERYMKCGVGICGVCTCDGLRMCVDGPVMGENFLSRSSFFGKLHRDSTTKLLSW